MWNTEQSYNVTKICNTIRIIWAMSFTVICFDWVASSAYMGQVKGCRTTLYCTLYCTQSVLISGYIQRLTAYELNGLSI